MSVTFIFDLSKGGKGNYEVRRDLGELVKELPIRLYQGTQAQPKLLGAAKTLRETTDQLHQNGLHVTDAFRRTDGKVVFLFQTGEENTKAKEIFLRFVQNIGWELAVYRSPEEIVIAGMNPVYLSNEVRGEARDWSGHEVSIFRS